MMYSIALKIAAYSAWKIDEKGGRDRSRENDVDDIQKAVPTPKGDLEPSVKMRLASETSGMQVNFYL